MRNKNKYQLKRDVLVPWQVMESDLFRSLSGKAMWVLIRFLQKRKWEKGRSKKLNFINYGLLFTHAEALEMGISKSRFVEIVELLVKVGFLDIEHQGGIHKNDPSRYAYSERWMKYGTPDFKAVEKPRVLWKDHDVRTWMRKKDGTESCTETVRKAVPMGEK